MNISAFKRLTPIAILVIAGAGACASRPPSPPTPPAATPTPVPPPPPTPTPAPPGSPVAIFFDADQSLIRPDQVAALEQDVAYLKTTRSRFEVRGFAGDSGIEEDDRALAERRATAVKVFLVARGVPADQLHASGESARPGADPSQSRRVEIHSAATAAPGIDDPFTIVRVYYGTDRAAAGQTPKGQEYGPLPGPAMSYGMCTVSIPKDHRIGHWEKPSILTFTFSEDPEKHVILLSVQPHTEDDFFGLVQKGVDRDPGKEAFVFVHGYNTTFDSAIQQTALLAYDMKFLGAPIAYSWPSRGELAKYFADEDAVQLTVENLQRFLREVSTRSGARVVHVIGHSMGNRALTQALAALKNDATAPPLTNLGEVALTAPDMYVPLFTRAVEAMKSMPRRVTLYASSNDQALTVSHRFHDNARAGDAGEQILVIPGVDSIDVSSVSTGFLGHSYFRDNTSVISDLIQLFAATAPGQRSCLAVRPASAGSFWVFACPPP